MTSTLAETSPRSCRSRWPSAVFFAVMAAALAASLSGCMRAGANTTTAAASSERVAAPQVHTLVAIEKKTPDGRVVEVPLAEEYRSIRPAGATPAIPPSETWPAQ